MSSQPQEPINSTNPQTTTEPQSSPSATKTEESPKPTINPRLTALETRKATLTQTLADLKSERLSLASQTKLPSGLPLATTNPSTGLPLSEDEILAAALKSSNAVVKEHITLLHKYNEIKDIGQGLMGLIADKRDCRVKVVMEEFGVGEKD
jgi:DNA repair protein Swi5/Sae3